MCDKIRVYCIPLLVQEDFEMTATISIEIPREIMHTTHMTPQELRQELAIHLFQQGLLSLGKARELANMSVWAFQLLLGSRGN